MKNNQTKKGNTEMKRFLASTVATSALALMLALSPATAQEEKLDPNAKPGGEIVITYKDDVATLDPAIGYDWQNWSMIKSLYDGLMDYEPGTTNLRPDLAESYEISPDGKTFTFKLRQGVKFHNGREMTADDVKYSLDRVTNPKTQSPGAGFFGSIAGFEDVAAGKSESLSGVTVIDPNTIKIELSRPDATFLHVMAINFSHVVPKEAVDQHGADFGKNPVGTGAYRMAEWTLGQRLVFERNPDHWHKGLPYLDKITFEIGQEPIVALLRLQKGEVDIPGDGIPPAKFQEVMNDPEQKARVVVGGQLHTGYVTMNTTMAPFDNVKVRQAVNMAINKDRIVQLINNRAVPANQPLPPSMPGYDKDYKGYAYDPEKAKALLAEAGHPDGFETELFVMNTDPNPRIAQAIQQDLSVIGIKANLQSLAQANVIAAGGDKAGAPMIWSGGMAWIADFPDPSNFYGPILGCGGAVPGGWNWAWYCNEDLDKQAAEADSITDPAKAEERYKMWSEIYGKVMEDAPWAPVFNEQRFTMKSPRMGGADNLYVDPVHIPINYDYVYVNDVQ
jgi:peptide/nickel transport system substrate-binding protein/oligopeptide transport system substrate-binding protein